MTTEIAWSSPSLAELDMLTAWLASPLVGQQSSWPGDLPGSIHLRRDTGAYTSSWGRTPGSLACSSVPVWLRMSVLAPGYPPGENESSAEGSTRDRDQPGELALAASARRARDRLGRPRASGRPEPVCH